MKKLNILFLGGGRRVALARNFLNILNKRYNTKIFAYEIDKSSSFSQVGKIILGKQWRNRNIFYNLKYNIKKYKIDLIIPCTDPATIVAAELAEKNKELNIPISTLFSVKICFDKLELYNYLKNKNINLIPLEKKLFPIFAKPRNGSASIGCYKIKNQKEMNNFFLNIDKKNYIFQKYIQGKEYTVDVYINNNNRIEGIVSRERVRVMHGESIFIKTTLIKKIDIEVKKIIRAFDNQLKGPITFQFIKNKKKFFLLEINPRVSGGINASIYSGLNIPFYLVRDYYNLDTKFKFKFKKVQMVKYFEEMKI